MTTFKVVNVDYVMMMTFKFPPSDGGGRRSNG